MTLVFWILAALTVFAIALAAQMRLFVSLVLRRALAAKFGGQPGDAAYRAAVYNAGRRPATTEAARHLHTEYPAPLAHLALARQVSLIAPAVLLGLVLIGRFFLRVI